MSIPPDKCISSFNLFSEKLIEMEGSLENKVKQIAPIHLGYLDGLRALAALYVVVHHAGMQLVAKDFYTNLLGLPFTKGGYAVDVFIVLSGFCMMLPVVRNNGVLKDSFWSFIKKRAVRILPTYYLALSLSLLLASTLIKEKSGTVWDVSIPISYFDVGMHLILMHDIFLETATKINYVFWSISVEWRIYFLFPLIVLLFKRYNPLKVCVSLIAFSFLIRVLLEPLPQDALNLGHVGIHPHYIGLFALGILASLLCFSEDYKAKQLKLIAYSNTLLCLVIVATIAADFADVHWMLLDLLVGCSATLGLISLSTNQLNWAKQILSGRMLMFVGSFAYSLYLIHAPLLQIITQYAVKPLGLSSFMTLSLLTFIGTPFIVVGSYLFYLVAEKPFMKKKLKLTQAAVELELAR